MSEALLKVVFGGAVAYVPQLAWIRNATLRQNVTFGQDDDEDRWEGTISMTMSIYMGSQIPRRHSRL